MTIKEFFNQYRKPILYWLVLAVVVLIAAGAVWWSGNENLGIIINIDNKGCIQIAVPMRNQNTGECKIFPTPCDVPSPGWIGDKSCENNDQIARKEIVFFSQEECEQKTNQSCVFQNCDFIPMGKTFEETCGKDFKKGWVPKNSVLDQTPPEKQKIIGKIIFSDIEGGCWNFQGDNGERFLIGGDDKSEEIKIIPNILSKKVEIQGKIEKDIVSYCPVGDGLFKLESYRVIDDNAANAFNKFLD